MRPTANSADSPKPEAIANATIGKTIIWFVIPIAKAFGSLTITVKSSTVSPIPRENMMNASATGKITSIITLLSSSVASSSATTDPVTRNSAKIANIMVRAPFLIILDLASSTKVCLIRAAKQSTQQQGKATAPIPDLAKSPPLHR